MTDAHVFLNKKYLECSWSTWEANKVVASRRKGKLQGDVMIHTRGAEKQMND
jgi:hypothetical protein